MSGFKRKCLFSTSHDLSATPDGATSSDRPPGDASIVLYFDKIKSVDDGSCVSIFFDADNLFYNHDDNLWNSNKETYVKSMLKKWERYCE